MSIGHRRESNGCMRITEGKFMDLSGNMPEQVVQYHVSFNRV
jgi:hypothetical protein